MRYLYTIFAFCICCATAFANPDTTSMKHFDLSSGFPSNNVYSLLQDRLGYLWFATDNGVVKYNGYSFSIFNTSTGLPSNDVYQLYEDDEGNIWLNSMSNTLGYIHNNAYRSTSLALEDRTFHAYHMVNKDRYLFLLYQEHGYYSVATLKNNDLLTTTPVQFALHRKMPGSNLNIYGCIIGPDCKIWGLTENNDLYMADLLHPEKSYRRICKGVGRYPEYLYGAIEMSNGHNICYWEYKSKEVFVVNTKTCSYSYLPVGDQENEVMYTMVTDRYTHEKHKNNFVITNTFLYTYDSNLVLRNKQRNDSLIPSTSQLAYVLKDCFNNTWYTTNSAGSWCVFKKYDRVTPLDLGRIKDAKYVGQSRDGTTYWWNKNAALLSMLGVNGNITQKQFPLNSVLNHVADYSDSVIYMLLYSGIYKYNRKTDELVSIRKELPKTFIHHYSLKGALSLDNDTTEKVYFGSHNMVCPFTKDVFFSLANTGLLEYRYYQDSLVARLITDDRYTNLYVDPIMHRVYAYNAKKVAVYGIDDGKYFVFSGQYLNQLGITEVLNIEVDKYGNIYLQDNARILVYSPGQRRIYELKTDINLLNTKFHICGDKIVLAGKYGVAIAKLSKNASIGRIGVIPNFDYRYYNRIYDFILRRDSDILLNTDKGFYEYDLRAHAARTSLFMPAEADFFRLILNAPYERKINSNDTIALAQKNEKITFDAVNLYGKGNVAYKYFIDGYSKDWQQSDGEVYLGSFAPGRYYRVTCISADEMWKTKPVQFYIYKIPYWWQTLRWQVVFWIFGITLVILLLLLVILATRAVVARANEKKRALLELELRALYAQINPHFIFNTLSAAQFFISKKRFDDAYVHINKFSRLLRAYLKSSQGRYITLDEEVNMLKNYIELQQIRFEKKFEYRIEVDNKVPAANLQIPSLLLQPLVENAITHGLFHKEGEGLLIIKFMLGGNGNTLICYIEDNGIGRDRARQINKSDIGKRESYGTQLTQQLINIYKEYEHIDISLEYIDKSGTDTGTIVKLTINNIKYLA